MADIITDEEIVRLLAERKTLYPDWQDSLKLRPKANRKHAEADKEVTGASGTKFILWIRKHISDPSDFTIGLRYELRPGKHVVLKRYNGPSHQHINHVERELNKPGHTFFGKCHIHIATERYQRANRDIDGFATITTEFSTLDEAIRCMISDNGFHVEEREPGGQKRLF